MTSWRGRMSPALPDYSQARKSPIVRLLRELLLHFLPGLGFRLRCPEKSAVIARITPGWYLTADPDDVAGDALGFGHPMDFRGPLTGTVPKMDVVPDAGSSRPGCSARVGKPSLA